MKWFKKLDNDSYIERVRSHVKWQPALRVLVILMSIASVGAFAIGALIMIHTTDQSLYPNTTFVAAVAGFLKSAGFMMVFVAI
ncbi:MAG: hypothetical protein NUW37_00545 [Planctomycetes bacterium]|nr:hypothetical protein [Planctomycetota bacterium]